MMKKLIFPLLLFCTNIVVAQNYQNICSLGTTYFIDNSGKLTAFRRDSVIQMGNNDTLFISYNAIRDTSGECRDTNSGSVLGRKILKKQNGWFFFFNRFQDTISLNTQATLNQTWKCFSLPLDSYIQAQVTSIITDSVFDTTDMVKVITFQAKNKANNNISHVLNGTTIKLSQHYGLSVMFDVYYFPDNTNFYSLAGKTFMNMGIQDISWEEVYNFNVGDIFHFSENWHTSLGAWYTRNIILTILDKTVYGNNDTISYEIEKCIRQVASYPPHYTNYFDTVKATYNFIQMKIVQPLLLPGEFVSIEEPPDYYAKIHPGIDRLSKGIITGTNIYNPETNCYSNNFESIYSDNSYTSGLGHTGEFWQYFETYIMFTYSHNLVYYKKGTEIWGTPVATDCFVLVSNENIAIPPEPSVEVSPNPVETYARIRVPGFKPDDNLMFSLYNYSGMKVSEGKVSSNSFILSRNGLSTGLYILSISDRDGNIKGRTKIIFK